MINPDMPAQELRLHMGELTASEMRVARAAIRWANSDVRNADRKFMEAINKLKTSTSLPITEETIGHLLWIIFGIADKSSLINDG